MCDGRCASDNGDVCAWRFWRIAPSSSTTASQNDTLVGYSGYRERQQNLTKMELADIGGCRPDSNHAELASAAGDFISVRCRRLCAGCECKLSSPKAHRKRKSSIAAGHSDDSHKEQQQAGRVVARKTRQARDDCRRLAKMESVCSIPVNANAKPVNREKKVQGQRHS
jgi:hypothetical protein